MGKENPNQIVIRTAHETPILENRLERKVGDGFRITEQDITVTVNEIGRKTFSLEVKGLANGRHTVTPYTLHYWNVYRVEGTNCLFKTSEFGNDRIAFYLSGTKIEKVNRPKNLWLKRNLLYLIKG